MLNNQRKKGISWCDETFNPIAGRCLHQCNYCYMKHFWNLGNNAELQLKEHYINDFKYPKRLVPGDKIFVGSSTDMWGEWVPEEWIKKVLNFVKYNYKYTFQFLTKNPKRYGNFSYLNNAWYGTTMDGTEKTNHNSIKLSAFVRGGYTKFISFEPLLNFPAHWNYFDFSDIDWIIIGADSRKGAKKPPKKWADKLIELARDQNTAVWVKDKYGYPEVIKNFPL